MNPYAGITKRIHSAVLKAILPASAILILMASPSFADHSMGKACVVCHTLKSASVVQGSRNILSSQVADPLYGSDWYCGTAWYSTAETAGTQPLDCSYCHSSDGDIAFQIQIAMGGKLGLPAPPTPRAGSAHPVDVINDNATYPSNRQIICNDCHNGDGSASPAGVNGKLTPSGKCSKSDTDGYPNHKGIILSTDGLPGNNKLSMSKPWLSWPYGPDPTGSAPTADWFKDTATSKYVPGDMLCFVCHDKSNATGSKPPFSVIDETGMTDIMGEYNLYGGGHNVPGVGAGVGTEALKGLKKLPCYNCHDPHAGAYKFGADERYNHALIIATPAGLIVNPYDENADNQFTYNGYDPATSGDRALCLTCHSSSSSVLIETVSPVDFEATISQTNLVFGFHKNAHSEVASSGNCLQANGGCHQSPHNTSPYDCLGCHTSGNGNYAKFPDKLKKVSNVDSEFDQIGYITGNGIKSQHDITYNKTGDLHKIADNGCLKCHSVTAADCSSTIYRVGFPNSATEFTPNSMPSPRPSVARPSYSDIDNLKDYNIFCAACHDGSDGANERFSTFPAPRVSKYYEKGGHGTGLSDINGSVNHFKGPDPAQPNLHNSDAKIACLECHQYHGSTAYKLLPGNVQTTDFDPAQDPYDKGGRVVKGFDYTSNQTDANLGTRFTIGKVPDSTYIDYKDYTLYPDRSPGSYIRSTTLNDDKRSWKFANYVKLWNTYYGDNSYADKKPATDSAKAIQFGTTGEMVDLSRVGSNEYAENTSVGEWGFCFTCHYTNSSGDTETRAAVETNKWTYTHEGTGPDVQNHNGSTYPSNKNFVKDCTECHDVHGSGSYLNDAPNYYMIKGKVTIGTDLFTSLETYDVIFDDPQNNGIFVGTNSGNDADGTSNLTSNDICAVCHTETSYHKRENTSEGHNPATDCFGCHPHGRNTPDRPWIAFMPSSCAGCHGFPPESPALSTSEVPLYKAPKENYTGGGGPHVLHVNFIARQMGAGFDPTDTSKVKTLCGVCHGETTPTHSGSYSNWGAYGNKTPPEPWPIAARGEVDIGVRTLSSWASGAAYDASNPRTLPAKASGVDMTVENSRCINVSCHDDQSGTKLGWYVTTAEPDDTTVTVSGANAVDASNRTRICADCHDSTPPDIRIYDQDNVRVFGEASVIPTPTYTFDKHKINVAANYFGTESTYGRGGHGDPKLNSSYNLDVNSDTNHDITVDKPIDCTACHKWKTGHNPTATTNYYRLRNTVVEANSTAGLCNECHIRTSYPGSSAEWHHHPSYWDLPGGTYLTKFPIGNQVVPTTGWVLKDGVYGQTGYGPGSTTVFGSDGARAVDYFTDWYNRGTAWTPSTAENHKLSPSPRGVFLGENGLNASSATPKATLPLAQFIMGTGGSKMICVTCHNPHGTDLFVYDETGVGRDIADHNMLRLQDTDNTLCNACH